MDVARDDSPQHPVPGVAPAYLESRIAIGERWKIILPDSILFCDLSDRMIAIIHPIQTRRIHLYMSEEHLIASTVHKLCRGMRYPNCDIRALFMISINFH